jgi:hypothetical protein
MLDVHKLPSGCVSVEVVEIGVLIPDQLPVDLVCPCCGGGFLHHDAVVDFYREEGKEDAPISVRTTVREGRARTDRVSSGLNPSLRRDGLLISFWCEGCGGKPQLVLVQHKGASEISWCVP